MKLGFLLLVLISCSGLKNKDIYGPEKKSELKTFQLKDGSGEFLVKRESKVLNGKLLTRMRYISKDGVTVLESTVAVSRIGRIKNKVALLPEASQFKVWFEKEQYFSQIKINPKTRQASIAIEEPKPRWSGIKTIDLPKSRYFCFYTQLPECMKMQNLLLQSARSKVQLYIIWDNFPFHQDLYEGMGEELISLASLTVSDHNKDGFKFSLDIGSQILFFHYDKNLNFQKLFWVAQGISMIDIKGN